jgi:hypothetical protein
MQLPPHQPVPRSPLWPAAIESQTTGTGICVHIADQNGGVCEDEESVVSKQIDGGTSRHSLFRPRVNSPLTAAWTIR